MYTTTSKTKKTFYTTALGAALNLLLNFVFVKPLGLQGVALGSCLGYVIVAIVRAIDMYKDIQMNFDLKRTFSVLIILILQTICTISGSSLYFVIGIISLLLIGSLYRKEIIVFFRRIMKKFEN